MNSAQTKILFISFSIMLLFGCGKDEPVRFSAQSVEVFAYDLVDAWEINASAIVKGVQQDKVENIFQYNLNYSADLITPDDTKIEKIFNDNLEGTSNEILADVPIDIQFELGSTFKTGTYKLVISITDKKNGNSTSVEKEFELYADQNLTNLKLPIETDFTKVYYHFKFKILIERECNE